MEMCTNIFNLERTIQFKKKKIQCNQLMKITREKIHIVIILAKKNDEESDRGRCA